MKQLLFSVTKDDFEIQTFRGSGAGGQHRNKTDSAVRIVHKESGAIGQSQNERSQHQNKKIAFRRLVNSPKFKVWLARKTKECISKQTIEEKVEKMMTEDNLIFECQEDKKWVVWQNNT